MKNTRIPLDIIFLNDDRIVINIEEDNIELNVKDSDLKAIPKHCTARYAVEVNQCLSEAYGIGEGTAVMIEYR